MAWKMIFVLILTGRVDEITVDLIYDYFFFLQYHKRDHEMAERSAETCQAELDALRFRLMKEKRCQSCNRVLASDQVCVSAELFLDVHHSFIIIFV